MARRLFCEISVDEEVSGDIGVIDYVEREFGWLQENGIRLDFALIADVDDESVNARYCQYLIEWGMQHHEEVALGAEDTPMSYDDFVDNFLGKRGVRR